MGWFSARKEQKRMEEYQRQQEAKRLAKEAEEKARIDALYQRYEEIKEEERLEAERRAPLMDYPTVAFTKESLSWWLGAHIDMDKYAALPVVKSFEEAILNESKSFRDLGPLLVELSDLIERGSMDAKAAKWLIRAFVASYDIQNNGEYSPVDAKLAEHYHAVLEYLDSDKAKPSDAYIYLGEPAAREIVFDAVDEFLQTVYYGKGLPFFKDHSCYSGLRRGSSYCTKLIDRMDFFPTHQIMPKHSAAICGEYHYTTPTSYIMTAPFLTECGEIITRPITEKENMHPRRIWDEEVNKVFGGDRYKTAAVYHDIAAICAHSYSWRDNEVRADRMEYCSRNMGESRVHAMLVYWVSQHPEWKIIRKDCIGPYSDKCIRLSASGRGPQEIDHLLVGPYGVIQIETKNYIGYLTIGQDKRGNGKWTTSKFSSSSHGDEVPCPIEQVRSHEVSLQRILGDVPLHSFVCISSPGSVITTPPEEIAKVCPYDVIDYASLDDYLSQMRNFMAAKVRIPYNVNDIVACIERAKVRNLLRGETAEYKNSDDGVKEDPSVISTEMPTL